MPKQVYCAKCGTELVMQLKAVPAEGKVISVVEPHTCDEKTVLEITEKAKGLKHVGTTSGRVTASDKESNIKEIPRDLSKKAKVAALFDDFPFVKKLNKEAKEHEVPEVPGDRRNKKFHREELVTSTAPLSILSRIPSEAGKTIPEHEMEEPEDE